MLYLATAPELSAPQVLTSRSNDGCGPKPLAVDHILALASGTSSSGSLTGNRKWSFQAYIGEACHAVYLVANSSGK